MNKDSTIELTNLTFEGFAENINDRGLEFNTKYILKVSAKNDDAKPVSYTHLTLPTT